MMKVDKTGHLFRYTWKVKDWITVQSAHNEQQHNEKYNYYPSQYYYASDTLWRALQFEIIDKHSPVVELDTQF